MLKKYLLYLFRQFCEVKGIDPKKTTYETFYSEEFADWIYENRELLALYQEYLLSIGIDCTQINVFEIGKGKFDSLNSYGVKVITPFASTFDESYSRLMISEGKALAVNLYGITELNDKVLLTHNPYFGTDITKWPAIHNLGRNNISIGMFGKLDDENAKKKIELIEKLSKKMTDDHTLDIDTINGNYFCSLNSKRKKLVKLRTRDRW